MWGNEQLIGTVIDGKYRLDRIIGNGGMGAVFGGTHLQLGRMVAIKVLRSDFSADNIAHARFVREARASARIEHPNAIHVYDFGAIPGVGAYLVMEYADGVSLRELLLDRGRLSLELSLDILRQTASALEAAHANGVVHRDVKPENLMVCFGADTKPIVKVVDFGIAKLASTDGSTQLTAPQDLIGTPRYMAPEIFTGDEVDGRVDVYALGVVLFEMLTGRPPFDGTFSEVIGKHIYTEPPTLADFGVECDDDIGRVVATALAKSLDDRYQRPLDLARAFAEACGPDIAAAVPPPAPYLLHTPPANWDDASADEALTLASSSSDDRLEHLLTRVGGTAAPKDGALDRPRFSRFDVPLSATLATIARARGSVGGLFEPAAERRWSVPAALALAAVLTFGVLSVRSQSERESWLAGAARSHVVATQPEHADAASTQSVEPADDAERPVANPPRRTKRSTVNTPAAARRDSGMRRFGRALRLDRHVRRIF